MNAAAAKTADSSSCAPLVGALTSTPALTARVTFGGVLPMQKEERFAGFASPPVVARPTGATLVERTNHRASTVAYRA